MKASLRRYMGNSTISEMMSCVQNYEYLSTKIPNWSGTANFRRSFYLDWLAFPIKHWRSWTPSFLFRNRADSVRLRYNKRARISPVFRVSDTKQSL